MYPLPEVQRMKVNHANFNQRYVVYTNHAAQASLILTGSMLDHMLLIKTKLEKDIVFSFVRGRCYIAVPFEENLLELTNKGLRDKEEIKNYFYSILPVFNIIRKLELNRLT